MAPTLKLIHLGKQQLPNKYLKEDYIIAAQPQRPCTPHPSPLYYLTCYTETKPSAGINVIIGVCLYETL